MQGLAKQSIYIMFIEFLIEKLSHLRDSYKTDEEMREHFLSGEVTVPIPDLLKYVEEWEEKRGLMGAYYPETPVVVNFPNSGIIRNCQVEATIITKSTVYYDVSVKMSSPEWDKDSFAKMQRVHSAHVWDIKEFSEYYKKNPTLKELQAILYKMDYYKLKEGFIAPVSGGELTFFEKEPSFGGKRITRTEILYMIDQQ